MTRTVRAGRWFSRARSVAIAGAAVLVVVLSSCVAQPPVDPTGSVPAPSGSSPAAAGQIVLRFDGQVVPATLSDGAAGREFSAMLPLTLDLQDRWGQAKSGRLTLPIGAEDASLVTDPAVGGIYYSPASGSIAIFYDDLGQAVPDDLVQLGAVDSDLDAIGTAGHRIRLLIYPVDHTSN